MSNEQDKAGVVAPPPFLYLGALLAALALHWTLPLQIADTAPIRWLGAAVAMLSIAFGVWARRTMVAAGTNVDPRRPSTAIVTSGPFRLTRNPLYVALALLFIGLTLVGNTWWGIIALVPLLFVMHQGVVLREERYLEAKFGDEYRAYKAHVARYLPLTGVM